MQLGRVGLLQHPEQADAVDVLLRHAVHLGGDLQPGGSHDRGHEVHGVRELGAYGTGRAMRPPQCTMSGVRVPPSQVYRFQSLCGVLPAQAQAHE